MSNGIQSKISMKGGRIFPPTSSAHFRFRASERPWQPKDMLGDIAQNEVRGDRRDLVQAGLAEFALDIVVASKPKTAMELDACVCRLPRGLGSKIFRHVGL